MKLESTICTSSDDFFRITPRKEPKKSLHVGVPNCNATAWAEGSIAHLRSTLRAQRISQYPVLVLWEMHLLHAFKDP